MAVLRVDLAAAYVLRTQPFRDTSLLVDAWTRDHGRIAVVARGARNPKARLRALLQPFSPLLLSWNDRDDLGTLIRAEPAGAALPLQGEVIFAGWYLNELLLRLLHRHDPHDALYDVYEQTLNALPVAMEPALRRFEALLLAELGYGLDLSLDFVADRRYSVDAEGVFELLAPVNATTQATGVSGAGLMALRDETLSEPDHLREVRHLLGSRLRALLGDRPLESARLLREFRRRTTDTTSGRKT